MFHKLEIGMRKKVSCKLDFDIFLKKFYQLMKLSICKVIFNKSHFQTVFFIYLTLKFFSELAVC